MIKHPNIKFMNFVIEKAKKSLNIGKTPFAACLVSEGKIISYSINNSTEMELLYHAEISCIIKAIKKRETNDLINTTLYTTCEPCPMCFSFCHRTNISRIVYGIGLIDIVSFDYKGLQISIKKLKELGQSKIEIIGNFLYNECFSLFEEWKNK